MRVPRIMAKAPGKDAGELDEVKVDRFAAEFREAFFADCTEEERADRVYEIHLRVCTDHDVYSAVGTALGTRLKRAIRFYVDAYRGRGKPSLIDEIDRHEADIFSE